MAKTLTIEVSDELSGHLQAQAAERGMSPAQIVADHLAQAHRVDRRNRETKRQSQLLIFISVSALLAAICLLGAGYFVVSWLYRNLEAQFAGPQAPTMSQLS